MNLVLIVLCVAGVLIPAGLALAAVGSPMLRVTSAVGALVIEVLCVVLWWDSRSERKVLDRRLRLVAAPLSGDAPTDEDSTVEVSVFRQRRAKSWLLDQLTQRFSMIDVRKSLPKAVGLGAVGAVVLSLGAVFANVGLLSLLLVPVGWLGISWAALAMQDAGQRAEFLKLFPEAVDHVVNLMRAGLPSVEAISVVAEEAQPPVNVVLQEIAEGVSAGLDPEKVIRGRAAHVRISEFTLFAAAICLQRTTGGGVSGALNNLSATLRARRETAAKAHSSTAQTRLTLVVLTLVPVVVLLVQNFSNPQTIETLFFTESGTTLLRYGVGCIVAGLLVARGLAARVGR
jgi:tight adherence protein B